MEEQLIAVGLTAQQAKAYLYLLSYPAGRKPAQVAQALGLTRTNAYKVLDQLSNYDLARKSEHDKTFRYFAENPIALASFVSEARNRAIELEKQVKESLQKLQVKYQKNMRHTHVTTGHGRTAIIHAYQAQAKQPDTIYFIRSVADISFMGFDTMHTVRMLNKKLGTQRFGLTPDHTGSPLNPSLDERSNLTRTWICSGGYNSPVEWTLSGNTLRILSFTDTGTAITIQDPAVANSFREIWHLLDRNIRANPEYTALPLKAKRKV